MNLFSRLLPALVAAATLLFIASVPKIQSAVLSEAALDQADKKDGCEVCHNGTNPHTVFVPCRRVDTYLANHPGDYAGPCQNVSPEKPPKPKPTPKP